MSESRREIREALVDEFSEALRALVEIDGKVIAFLGTWEEDRHIDFFCTQCSYEWSSSSIKNKQCQCGSRAVLVRRPSREDYCFVEAAALSDDDLIIWEESGVDSDGKRIYGIYLPPNYGIITRDILDYDTETVELADGTVVGMDDYFMTRIAY